MYPNLVLNQGSTGNIVDWQNLIKIDNKYLTSKKNVRANIQSLDKSKISSKFLVQLGTGISDNYKILFGISNFGGQISERSDLNIELSDDAAVNFAALDEFIVNSVIARKEEFFEKPKSDAFIRDAYYSCVKQDKEGKYNPNLKTKITLSNNEDLSTKVFEWVKEGEKSAEGVHVNESKLVCVKNEHSIRELVQPRTQCMTILQIQSLWFKNDSWGVSIETRLLAVFNQPKEVQFFMPSVEAPAVMDVSSATPQFAPAAADEESLKMLDEKLIPV